MARGHIWGGERARDRKLVDQIGGLMDAIHRAEELAGVSPEDVDYELYPESLGLFDLDGASAAGKLARRLLGEEPRPARLAEHSALGRIVRRLGQGIMLPLVYEDGEALMLLPHAVEDR